MGTRAFVVAMVLLSAVPLLYPPVPPLVDLLGHMGRYRVMLDGDVPSLAAKYSFKWALMQPWGRSCGLSAGAADRARTGGEAGHHLIPMMTTAGMLWVAREVHHRLPPTVMFALPLVYGHHFLFGFVNYAMSVALAMLAFGLWLRLGRKRRYRLRAALFVPISILVWLCHAFGWGFLGLLAFSSEVVRAHDDGRSWWRAILRAVGQCMSLALPLVLMLVWREGRRRADRRLLQLGEQDVLREHRAARPLAGVGPDQLFPLPGRVSVRDRPPAPHPVADADLYRLVLGAAFVCLPRIIFGSAYADMRLMPFVFAFALLAIRFRRDTPPVMGWMLAVLALGFFLARTASVTWSLKLASDGYERS